MTHCRLVNRMMNALMLIWIGWYQVRESYKRWYTLMRLYEQLGSDRWYSDCFFDLL